MAVHTVSTTYSVDLERPLQEDLGTGQLTICPQRTQVVDRTELSFLESLERYVTPARSLLERLP